MSFFILDWRFPLEMPADYSPVVLAADGQPLYGFLNGTWKWRIKTEMKEITPLLEKTILFKEDKYFYYHPGINPFSFLRAAFRNMFQNGAKSGASTITMQVARMLEPKKRTYINKGKEIFRAFQLEWHYRKGEILQLYLNLLPYGSNLEGVKSAALIYFRQTPGCLSPAQVATLTVIPNKPRRLVPGRHDARILEERNKWLRRFGEAQLLTGDQVRDALDEPLFATRQELNRFAPHFSIRVRDRQPRKAYIATFLNRKIQDKAEALTGNYAGRLYPLGITNAAVIVLNNHSHAVEAYIGSADFRNAEHQGQVDGIRSVRSPGSTLKPLLYALAIDRGILTPRMHLNDVPVNFSGYRPENYDSRFNGDVTAEDALLRSLNVPAVRVLQQAGVPALTEKLKMAGCRNISGQEKSLGLSLILGGCGLSLEELTGLYSVFACGGLYHAPRFTGDDREPGSIRVISPAAAFMITEILSNTGRPELPPKTEFSTRLPKIAWKTGTSYGRRDAWSIGYNTHYTIGVWLGNFDGAGSPELSGADIATPLLFRLFNAIDYSASGDWFPMPRDAAIRYVCSVTGLAPETFCENQVLDYYIPGVSPSGRCTHLKKTFLAANGEYTYCMACLPENNYRIKLLPDLSPELASFYKAGHIPYTEVPPHNPYCMHLSSLAAGTAENPRIVSPSDQAEYFLDKEDSRKILLSCQPANHVQTIYWYMNDKFLRAAPAHSGVFIEPAEGQVKISCADDLGRNTDVYIKVTYIN